MWRDDGYLLDVYRNINLTKVWESVQLGVPRLIEQLERLVLPEGPPRCPSLIEVVAGWPL